MCVYSVMLLNAASETVKSSNVQDSRVCTDCGFLQVSPIAAATAQGNKSVPLPKAKVVEPRTWAQRVAADGRKYFLDPVTRQTTWHDPLRSFAPYDCHVQLVLLLLQVIAAD